MLAHNPRLKGILLASFTALLWGFLAIALKVSVGFANPATIVWFRFFIAFILLFLIYFFKDKSKLNVLKRPPALMFLAAICLGINYIGYMMGISYTTPGNTQIIIQLGPIFLALVGVVIYRERLTVLQGSGFIIAGFGFILFYRTQLNNLISDQGVFNQGIAWVILAALCWVVYASATKKLIRQWSAQQVNIVVYGVCAIIFIPFTDFQSLGNLTIWQWALMFFLGINTLLAYGALAASFKYIEANKVSIIITLNPIITLIAMAVLTVLEVNWIAPERLTLPAIIAAALIITGAIIAVKTGKK